MDDAERITAADIAAEAEISALLSEMDRLASTRDPDKVYPVHSAIKSYALPAGSQITSKLASAQQAADAILQQAIASDRVGAAFEEEAGGHYPPKGALAKAVWKFMSEEEQAYFESINPEGKYKVVELDQDGNIKKDASGKAITREENGETLRDDIVRITKESLPPEEQKRIDKEVEEEIKKSGEAPERPESRTEELDKLEESLKRIEGKKAAEILEAKDKGEISEEQAEEKIRENHKRFKGCRGKVRCAREEHEKAESAPEAAKPLAESMVNEAEKDLRKSLEDVRKIIPEKAEDAGKAQAKNEEREQGMQVATLDTLPDQFIPGNSGVVPDGPSKGRSA